MEVVSFTLIAVGALLSLTRRAVQTGGRLSLIDLLATLAVAFVALLATAGLFIGPVGDAGAYHQDINACLAQLPPCSNKLHEMIWGLISSLIGPAWGLIYGFVISSALAMVASGGHVSARLPFIALLFLYAAYQVGNGMAEGTYFLLLLGALLTLQARRFVWGNVLLLGGVVAHLGNLPFLAFLSRFPKAWPSILAGLAVATVAVFWWSGFRLENLLAITNKAGALISKEATYAALETKLRVSVRDAETSYAGLLLDNGFPYTVESLAYAILLYVVPVFAATKSLIAFLIALLSSAFSLAAIWLSRNRPVLLLITLMSFVIFGAATYAPGISLRHKVPLLLFLLAVRNPRIMSGGKRIVLCGYRTAAGTSEASANPAPSVQR